MPSPAEHYQQQKLHYESTIAMLTAGINRIAMLRLWTVIAAIAVSIWAYRSGVQWHWWGAGALGIAFLALVRRHYRLTDRREYAELHLYVITGELQALEGNYTAFPDGGAYTDVGHPYSFDLDIFGKGSVYQMLCRSVTMGGAARLAGRLASLVLTHEHITMQQGITTELAAQPDMLRHFRVAGMGVKETAKDQERLTEWLEAQDEFISSMAVRVAAAVLPLAAAACIVLSVIQGGMFPGLGIVIAINWAVLGAFRKKITVAAQQVGNSARLVDKYERLLTEVAEASFTGSWLRQVGAGAKASLAQINRFKKLVNLFDTRSNGMIGPVVNTFFLFDLICLLRLEVWRKQHHTLLLQAIANTVELDACVSCAVYAFNHPENVYPEITTGREIKATNLRHPLLPAKVAAGNDVSLGLHEQFYLLTGANMTGKSTFIRTIGVCNVMANMGLPLPAASLALPLLDLYTSMRITDSVQDDISYFKAELNRIKAVMSKIKDAGHPCLVLLDEPLRGTNSADKQQGTRAIVEQLLDCSATGIVATHDAVLCDMEQQYPGKVRNYHFESKVEDDALTFDFKLQPGASTSNNATILMRMMGIIK